MTRTRSTALLCMLLALSPFGARADQFLKQSTASQEVLVGPFVDDTDFKTPETALTISNTDVKLFKAGATSEVSKNSGGCTHMANGRYYCVLDATDTNTLGSMVLSIRVAGALDEQKQLQVVSANVYDDWFGSTNQTVRLGAFTHTGAVVPTVTTLTGHTPQTGDAFARLGAPAGASVSADVAGIKTKTDFLPSATAGAAGGVFIAGTNAATTITSGLTANLTGNVSGSVGSVTGAVGSVTGNVGGSVASVAAGGISASSLATDAITAAKVAADVSTEIWSIAIPEPTTVPTYGTTSALQGIAWDVAWRRNKVTQSATTTTLRNDADNANVATCAVTDNGTTLTIAECSP